MAVERVLGCMQVADALSGRSDDAGLGPVVVPSASGSFRPFFVMNTPLVGGAERHTFDLMSAFAGRGCAPTVFSMKAGPLPPPAGVSLLQPERPRSLPQRIGDLGRILRDHRPDLVVAVNERPVLASLAGRLASRVRVPIVAILHSTVLRNRHERMMQLAYTPMINRIEGVVFISRNQRAYWTERGIRPRGEATIRNGVDLRRFSPALRAEHRDAVRARFGLGPEDFVVGLCAVMRPEKNHLQLVDAVADLRRRGLPVKALLVGDGPMRAAIEERARALGASDAVVLTGMQDDVRPLVSAFDVGCLCSVSIETLSLAALEVMAMGIPMVMSDIGGASEIVDGVNGRLFPVGSDAGLRDALTSLIDPKVRAEAGAEARHTVEQQFDRDLMFDRYFNHMHNVSLRGRLP